MEVEELSWRAIPLHVSVFDRDGVEVGKVVDVAALPNEDIFHGIVIEHHALGHHILVPAAAVGSITLEGVHLTATKEEVEGFGRFEPMHIERLGVKGLFSWKHLGWKGSDE